VDKNILEPMLNEHLRGKRILEILTAPLNANGSGRHSVTIRLEKDTAITFTIEKCHIAHNNGVSEWISSEYAKLFNQAMGPDDGE
jgi:hypothetical protein